MKKLAYFILFGSCLVIYLFVHPSGVLAVEIINPNFENGTAGWTTTTSSVLFSIVAESPFEASHSAKISYVSTTSNGIKQSVSGIIPNASYRISTQLKAVDGAKKAFMRIAWYQAGSSSQLKTDDSTILLAPTDWTTTEILATAPSNASLAEIRILVSEGSAFADHVLFEDYTPPTPTPSATPVPTALISAQPTPSIAVISIAPILISEVFPYPSSGQQEWVELYNPNDAPVELVDWYLDDGESSGSSPKQFSLNIPAKSYEVVELSSAMFNNSGDTVRLLDENDSLQDQMTYTASTIDISFSREAMNIDSFCKSLPTRAMAHSSCMSTTLTPTTTPTPASRKLSQTPTPIRMNTISSSNKPVYKVQYPQYAPIPQIDHIEQLPPPQLNPAQPILSGKDISKVPAHKRSVIPLAYSLLSVLSFSWRMYLSAKSEMI